VPASREVYAARALDQVPRLLGNLDRNPLSPTYGCFHRDYWLEKTSDFPDAVRQFAVQALALVYRHDFPGSPYRGNPRILAWTAAALDFWAGIQHADGSFDEFYPFERGWVGPTAFTAYTAAEACRLLGDELPVATRERAVAAVRRAAYMIAGGQSEEDHLANHHAMACLAVWKAHRLTGDAALRDAFDRVWRVFLTYHNAAEGWSREYDGTDPGYLSATVSFLAKIYQDEPMDEIRRVVEQSVAFAAYFAYPNGTYAGSLGSRNTLHFYPHGFEVFAGEIPLAARVADRMLEGLTSGGTLVPPGIMSDRYAAYRVPEYLQAYLDFGPRPAAPPRLPDERVGEVRHFPEAGICAAATPAGYLVANLAKGGAVKAFRREDGRLVLNDAGILARLSDGRVITSQWIDPGYAIGVDGQRWTVSGRLVVSPANKVFTPARLIVFRALLLLLGWHPGAAHRLKGWIRKTLILRPSAAPVRFERTVTLREETIEIVDDIRPETPLTFARLMIGGEFFVRYVPQSRYFQEQELEIEAWEADAAALELAARGMRVQRTVELAGGRAATRVSALDASNGGPAS